MLRHRARHSIVKERSGCETSFDQQKLRQRVAERSTQAIALEDTSVINAQECNPACRGCHEPSYLSAINRRRTALQGFFPCSNVAIEEISPKFTGAPSKMVGVSAIDGFALTAIASSVSQVRKIGLQTVSDVGGILNERDIWVALFSARNFDRLFGTAFEGSS